MSDVEYADIRESEGEKNAMMLQYGGKRGWTWWKLGM
jgi:hypothetical protein